MRRVLALPFVRELSAFGVVGALAFVVDIGVFNALRAWTMFGLLEAPLLGTEPITAKAISVAAATLASYVGNRHWTYRDRHDHPDAPAAGPQLTGFILANAIGLGISALCLFISHHLLGFTSALADNLSGNVIGVGLATLFRFAAYRTVIFPPDRRMQEVYRRARNAARSQRRAEPQGENVRRQSARRASAHRESAGHESAQRSEALPSRTTAQRREQEPVRVT